MLELRPYQRESVDAIYRHLRDRDDNPCVVIPTGGGKTPVMATVCRDAVGRWGGRVLILAHVKELLEQALEKIQVVAPEMWLKTGIYSAGLKSRDTEHPIIIAGIQSVYRRACELDAFDLVIIDEAHMIPPDGDGMYRTFLHDARKVNPNLRVIGLTATPFRMKSGMICEPGNILNEVCYEIGVKELIVQGYLCPLVTKGAAKPLDTSGLHVRAGEFVAGEAEALMDTDELVEAACREVVEQTRDRRAALVFATSIRHAEHVAEVLRRMAGEPVATVFGETASVERDQVLAEFKAGRVKYLVNVNVLTTGFDAPNIDCVAMVRPTLSPGLYYQMVGRGFRLSEGKENCLVLDFGGNVLRHGPVDAIRVQAVHHRAGGEAPAKQCPECLSLIATGYTVCPDCGYEFPPPERQEHEATASTEGILSGEVTTADHEVREVFYYVHTKKGAPEDAPKTLRVEYEVGFHQYFSEWVCFEHSGWARHKAESWWRKRSNAPVPLTAAEAVALAEDGVLCETGTITVRTVVGEQFPRIVGYELGDRPPWREPGMDDDLEAVGAVAGTAARVYDPRDDDDIPF
jgi:DNA repair protein RadD